MYIKSICIDNSIKIISIDSIDNKIHVRVSNSCFDDILRQLNVTNLKVDTDDTRVLYYFEFDTVVFFCVFNKGCR